MDSTSYKVRKLVRNNTKTEILEPSGPSISDLPDEVLLHVFSYLDKQQLVSTISCVCRHWYHLHRDPSLYLVLEFTKLAPDTQLAAKMIKMATWLQCLTMSFRTDLNDLLRHIPAELPRLKTLAVHCCTGSPDPIEVSPDWLLDLFDRASNIRNLTVNFLPSTSELTICKYIGSKLPLLRVVHFVGTGGDSAKSALLSLMENCDSIEELELSTWLPGNISDDVIATFFEKFSNTLRVVDVAISASWTDLSVTALARCHQLREIHFFDASELTDAAIQAISSMPNLVDMTMWNARLITAQGWKKFFETPHMKQITSLRLEGCVAFNDEVAHGMALNLKNLQLLILTGCKITFPLQLKLILPKSCQFHFH